MLKTFNQLAIFTNFNTFNNNNNNNNELIIIIIIIIIIMMMMMMMVMKMMIVILRLIKKSRNRKPEIQVLAVQVTTSTLFYPIRLVTGKGKENLKRSETCWL